LGPDSLEARKAMSGAKDFLDPFASLRVNFGINLFLSSCSHFKISRGVYPESFDRELRAERPVEGLQMTRKRDFYEAVKIERRKTPYGATV
jgi:hypothetical protein